MTLEVFYNEIGSDFKAALTRMGNSEKMLGKFVRKFLNDKTTSELVSSFESGDYETAFRMAHTLKGLCANLGLDKLRASSSELTEALRGGVVADNAGELLGTVRADYDAVMAALAQLDE
ncbi:MAG: Hpt domain-containing protein [Lachnospiraceae bacterium]|nr:Hpt domain-containing protein [Ruminococcus sp.]MCM1273748.1 Hpt domain-containing protein [Lachnospiraceae bacterium]